MLKLLGSFSNGRLLVRRFDCAEVLAALADVIDAPAGHHSSPLSEGLPSPRAALRIGEGTLDHAAQQK